jgi:hypothetical protein
MNAVHRSAVRCHERGTRRGPPAFAGAPRSGEEEGSRSAAGYVRSDANPSRSAPGCGGRGRATEAPMVRPSARCDRRAEKVVCSRASRIGLSGLRSSRSARARASCSCCGSGPTRPSYVPLMRSIAATAMSSNRASVSTLCDAMSGARCSEFTMIPPLFRSGFMQRRGSRAARERCVQLPYPCEVALTIFVGSERLSPIRQRMSRFRWHQ